MKKASVWIWIVGVVTLAMLAGCTTTEPRSVGTGAGVGEGSSDPSEGRLLTVEMSYSDPPSPFSVSYAPGYPHRLARRQPRAISEAPEADTIYFGTIELTDAEDFRFALTLPGGGQGKALFYVDANQNGNLLDDGRYEGVGTRGTGARIRLELTRSDGSIEPYGIWLWTSLDLSGTNSNDSPGFNFYAQGLKQGPLPFSSTTGDPANVYLQDENHDASYRAEQVIVDWNGNGSAERADKMTVGEPRFYDGQIITLQSIGTNGTEVTFSLVAAEAAEGGALDVVADLALEPIPGNRPQPLDLEDMDGQMVSLDQYIGKVVLIDFWATWCGPCLAELPNVLDNFEKYHGQGFEIIGVSLDTDRTKLREVVAEKGMAWRQIYDGKGWQAEIAERYRVRSIPRAILVGRDGIIISSNARGQTLTRLLEARFE